MPSSWAVCSCVPACQGRTHSLPLHGSKSLPCCSAAIRCDAILRVHHFPQHFRLSSLSSPASIVELSKPLASIHPLTQTRVEITPRAIPLAACKPLPLRALANGNSRKRLPTLPAPGGSSPVPTGVQSCTLVDDIFYLVFHLPSSVSLEPWHSDLDILFLHQPSCTLRLSLPVAHF